MSMIESIREFIRSCPLLKEGAVHIDFLGGTPVQYTIDALPSGEVLKTYADGGALMQLPFLFASREFYGEDLLQNCANSSFYEEFKSWINKQSRLGNLPDLGEGKQAQSIEALSSGYLFDGGLKDARYQIQLRVIYYEGGN